MASKKQTKAKKRSLRGRTRRTPKKGADIGLSVSHAAAVTLLDESKKKALLAFASVGTISGACVAAGIGRSTFYEWRDTDPLFANRFKELEEANTDELVEVAVKRAKGSSDTLLIFLLKSRRPEQYRETHKIELVHPKVRDNLRQTIAVINDECDHELANRVLSRLSEIWGKAA